VGVILPPGGTILLLLFIFIFIGLGILVSINPGGGIYRKIKYNT